MQQRRPCAGKKRDDRRRDVHLQQGLNDHDILYSQNVAGSGWYYVRVSNPSSPAVVGVGPASAAATGSEVTLYVMSGGYNSDFFALDPLGPAGNQGTNVIRFHGRHTSVPDWPTTPWQTLSYTTT